MQHFKKNMFVLKRDWFSNPEALFSLVAQVVEQVVNLQVFPFLDENRYTCKASIISDEDMKKLAQNSLITNGNYGPFIGENICLMVDINMENSEIPGTLKKLEPEGDTPQTEG